MAREVAKEAGVHVSPTEMLLRDGFLTSLGAMRLVLTLRVELNLPSLPVTLLID